MESKLLNDDYLKFHYRVSGLPSEISSALYAAAGTKEIANYGEQYNKTDAINPQYPMVQHQFSMFSEQTAAVVFRKGGFAPYQMLLIMDRKNPTYVCTYRIHERVDTKEAIFEILKEKEKYMNEYIFNRCKTVKVGS